MEQHVTDKIRLEQTCSACPEQYNAYIGDTQVGYLRLRHGYFSVAYPDCGDRLIFKGTPIGAGQFMPEERGAWLQKAKEAIIDAVKMDKPELL